MRTKSVRSTSSTRESGKAGGVTTVTTFSEVLGRTMQTLDENRRLFSGGIARLQLSVCLENGTKVDLKVHGIGAGASPKVFETHPQVEHDPCHDREYAEAVEASADIPSLKLGASAEAAAKKLLVQFPADVKFTSGRRAVSEQASAMAKNVLSNRKYIEQTYKASPLRDALQKWVNDTPNVTNQADIAKGLEAIMNTWSDDQRRNFSRHMTGDAFDVQPVAGAKGIEIKEAIGKLPKLHWMTFEEGGLEIWHAQFNA